MSHPLFVNLPLASIARGESHLELFAASARHGLTPTMTLEPFTLEDSEHSRRFMAHPQ